MPVQPDTPAPHQAPPRPQQHVRTVWGLVLLAGLALPYLAYWWADRISTDRLRAAGAQRLEVYATSLENLLDKYDLVPRMLELDKDVIRLLEHPGDEDARHSVNEYLEGLNRKAESSKSTSSTCKAAPRPPAIGARKTALSATTSISGRISVMRCAATRAASTASAPPAWNPATSMRTASTRKAACWA
jgi:hypothetical protein